jgi:hypothetical protein
MGHACYPTRPDQQRRSNVAVLQAREQFAAAVLRSLGDDLDPAVGQVLGEAGQAKLQRSRPDPPSEPDPLHAAAHPRSQPDLRGHVTTGRCGVGAGRRGRCMTTGS